MCRFSRTHRTFLLFGDLGSGKTSLTRGMVRVAGGYGVRSPTFTLVNVYKTPIRRIFHVDLYRVETPEDFYTLGVADFLGREMTIVEWADRLPERVEGVRVFLKNLGGNRREIRVSPD